MKADIDAAFRRIPVRGDHRWAACVTWLYKNEPWMASHIGMPFGAAASGIAWHKIGNLLLTIGRKLLGIPLYRYVDDYFAADRYDASGVHLDLSNLRGACQAGDRGACIKYLRTAGSSDSRTRINIGQQGRVRQKSHHFGHTGTTHVRSLLLHGRCHRCTCPGRYSQTSGL